MRRGVVFFGLLLSVLGPISWSRAAPIRAPLRQSNLETEAAVARLTVEMSEDSWSFDPSLGEELWWRYDAAEGGAYRRALVGAMTQWTRAAARGGQQRPSVLPQVFEALVRAMEEPDPTSSEPVRGMAPVHRQAPGILEVLDAAAGREGFLSAELQARWEQALAGLLRRRSDEVDERLRAAALERLAQRPRPVGAALMNALRDAAEAEADEGPWPARLALQNLLPFQGPELRP